MAVEQPVLIYLPAKHARSDIDFASSEAVATAATSRWLHIVK